MKKIYTLLLIVMMLWGINVSAIKVLVESVDPALLTAYRILVAGIGVLVICKVMGIFRIPTMKEFLIIFYIGIFNSLLHHYFVAMGLANTTGVNTGLIQGSTPLFTMMLSILLLKHHLSFIKVFGFLLGFIGVVITTVVDLEQIFQFSIGDFYIFLGVITQAYSFILISKIKPELDPRLLTGYMLVIAAVGLFLIQIFAGVDVVQVIYIFDWKLSLIFLFSALVCTAFGHMTYNYAIKHVGPAETTIFINLNTFFTLAFAALFLGEIIKVNHIVGLIFILSGVFLGSGSLEYLMKKKKRTKEIS